MKLLALIGVAALLPVAATAGQGARPVRALTPFGSDRSLRDYFEPLHNEYRRAEEARRQAYLEAQQAQAAACIRATTLARGTTSDGRTVLSGIVRDVSTEPLVGAQIGIPSLGATTTTDTDGRYRLTLPPDSLTSTRRLVMRAVRIGYLARHDTLTLTRGDSIEFAFHMCPVATSLQSVVTTGTASLSLAKDESITNTQHEGVDEGGIVKLHGDYLIVLRRGRLFTIDISSPRLRKVSMVDAYSPDVMGGGDWYDELLTYENRVIVIGYSYARRGTEINLFRIDARGRLTYESSHQLRSDDYYSAENYASRLIANKLVFYTPIPAPLEANDIVSVLPAMRRWDGTDDGGPFRRIAPASRVYKSPVPFSANASVMMHTVTFCDLDRPGLACESTVVIGPAGREFYVSPSAVYVWLSEWRHPTDSTSLRSFVYRLPLDGSPPSALGTHGSPIDQFSFLESDGHLNVAVRWDGDGNPLWNARAERSDVALLRVPLSLFSDGGSVAASDSYRPLPPPPTSHYRSFTNRFVGDYLVYGSGNGWGEPRGADSPVFVVPIRGGQVSTVHLAHGVDRIEPMGEDAVVIGSDSVDLHFSGIALDQRPRLRQRFVLREASQGETRSHGFFYRPNAGGAGRGGDRGGVLGLPVQSAGTPGYEHLFHESAAIVFVRNTGTGFERLGELTSASTDVIDDDCEASCVDWYGNSRPIFLRGRTFALMGYELVEGRIATRHIREVRRLNFAP